MARDDFTKSVIETLKARVAHRCSNPECRVPTSAPSSTSKVNNIGVAAHICAASPGGPRYDRSMSSAERKDLSNGIWLCSNCSIDIDRDEKIYTVRSLKEWRNQAEESSRAELGRKLPSNNETIDTVTTVLTGLPKSFIANAISNVHQASGKALELLDPRFLVKTKYYDGQASIYLSAKEKVALLMNVSAECATEYIDKHRQLIEHGKDVEITSAAIDFSGSKLFETLLQSDEGVFHISSSKKKATQKLWLVQKNTGLTELLDDIHGEISFGTKSFTYMGSSCSEVFTFSYQKMLNAHDNNFNITMGLRFEKWDGKDIRFLPYLNKLFSFFQKISLGWEIFTSLEIDGMLVLSSSGMNTSNCDEIIDMYSRIGYVNRCRKIAEFLNADVKFKSDFIYTPEEHRNIANIVEFITGEKIYQSSDLSSNVTSELIIDSEYNNLKLLIDTKDPISIRVIQQEEDDIELFGVNLKLPVRTIILDSVLPKIHDEINSLKIGDAVKVEWLPQENFKFSITY